MEHFGSRPAFAIEVATRSRVPLIMSASDYTAYAHKLPLLAGRCCSVSLATNSLKLHIDENKKDGSYLWIDPPWQFGLNDTLIDEAWTCPHHEDEGYKESFKAWREQFASISDSTILSIDAVPDGTLQMRFERGYCLLVPADQTPGEHDPLRSTKGAADDSPGCCEL